jgi:hypothetical protein
MNWTEILARSGVPEPPGREELLAQIRAEKEAAVQGDGDTVQPSRKRKRKKAPKR